MYRKQKHLRIAAIFCLLTFVQSLILPSVAHALTSGPTAPESTSFEPVDASDMVNLATGDFTYNVPLIEVPGPEGGYPLSLSYHGGIKPLTDASWVGLGWSLNPGAINRIVNGYPDDHSDVQREVTDIWEGGVTNTFSVGVSFGIAPGVGLGLDISISNDTYRGRSGDIGIGLSFNPLQIENGGGDAGAFGANVGISMGGSGFSASAGIGVAIGETVNIGVSGSTNFNGSNSIGASASMAKISVGANLSSNGLKGSFSVAGFSTQSRNSNFGKISTSTSGAKMGIPLGPTGIWLTLGTRYQRYWMHESDIVKTHGTLHANKQATWPDNITNGFIDPKYDDNSFDSYSLREEVNNPIEHPDPDWVWGGSFPSYDAYQVSGQGISGTMRPYIFENGTLYRKGKMQDPNKRKMSFSLANDFDKKVNFRFVNDFSNSLTLDANPSLNATVYGPTSSALDFTAPSAGFNTNDHHLAGSKHIEWFTNLEIRSGAAKNDGFINTLNISNTERQSFNGYNTDNQVGGYTITNESGVNYHYGLPVYAYDEYIESKVTSSNNGDSWNKQYNNHPYAFNWLLTSMTGSDYVDKNNNGIADEGDYGYWVVFDYGKWLDNYEWRTPGIGTHKDIKGTVDHFSYGKKQIYYLDAIKTRSHTALFVKDIRNDAKSVIDIDGNFEVPESEIVSIPCVNVWDEVIDQTDISAYIEFAYSSMKLEKIVLIKNQDLSSSLTTIKAMKNEFSYDLLMPAIIDLGNGLDCYEPPYNEQVNVHHNGNKVIDVDDYQQLFPSISSKIVRTIELDTDYSLSPETANSFDNAAYYSSYPTTVKSGKLTLNSLKYKGPNNQTTMPPLNFEYDHPTSYHYYNITSSTQMTVSGANSTWEGEILKYKRSGKDYYVQLNDHVSGTTFKYLTLGENTPSSSHSGSGSNGVTITKNPPFHNDKYDVWGFYKPDFTGNSNTNPESITRNPSHISACQTDSWNLRNIETSIGANIKVDFEPKKYHEIVFDKTSRMHMQTYSESNNRIYFKEDVDLTKIFTVNQVIKTTFATYSEDEDHGWIEVETDNVTITQVTENYIIITPPGFVNDPYLENIYKGYVDYDSGELCGDGSRVASISIEGDGDVRQTNYTYENGVIAFIPSNLNPPASLHSELKEPYYEAIKDVVNTARELPAPNVMYEYVEVSDAYNNNTAEMGKNRYHFKVFNKDMVDFGYTGMIGNHKRITIKNKTSQIGNLLSMKVYSKNPVTNNYQLVSSTENDYTDDEAGESESDYALYADQGRVEQAFNEVRRHYSNGGAPYTMKGVVSVRKDYPSILKSTTVTQNGIENTTHFRAYDFYTGAPTKVESEDSYGQNFVSITVPAYKRPEYASMGLKIFPYYNPGANKNMLTQTTAEYTYRSDGNGNPVGNPLSANVTTWEDDWTYRYRNSSNVYVDPTATDSDKVWRQHKNFVYKADTKPDGTYDNWVNFNWHPSSTNSNWLKVSEVMRYDHFSKALEEKGADGNYAGIKMGYEESLPLVTAAPAKYVEFAFSSAEDHLGTANYFGGEVKGPSSSAVVTTEAHTGDYSVRLNSGTQYGLGYKIPCRIYNQSAKPGEIERKKYEARVWIHESNISTGYNYLYCNYKDNAGNSLQWDGAKISDASTIKAGEWYQLRLPIEINNGNLLYCTKIEIGTWVSSSSSNVYFDDFRFAPVDAAINSYVYDQKTDQVTYVLDQENLFTQYEYDEGGRLIKVYRETTENPTGKRLVSENEYHYKRSF